MVKVLGFFSEGCEFKAMFHRATARSWSTALHLKLLSFILSKLNITGQANEYIVAGMLVLYSV